MKRNSKLMDNDIPLRSQIRTLRILLLGTISLSLFAERRFGTEGRGEDVDIKTYMV